jgi:hypothetical protein
MSIKRRDFVKIAGIAALSSAAFPQYQAQKRTMEIDPLNEKGIHPTLDKDHPYIFIDSCMQIWPDAQFEKCHRHGVTAYALTAWDPHMGVDEALEELMRWHLIARKFPNITIVTKAGDITDAKKKRFAAFLLASQCGDFIGYKLHRIEAFYRLGLRMLIPAYSLTNNICAGCLDQTDNGLTAFGELVVKECNRVGLLLDCSHLGRRSSLEIIERSEHPVVFSHSNSNVLVENPRNIDNTDQSLRSQRGNHRSDPMGTDESKKRTNPATDHRRFHQTDRFCGSAHWINRQHRDWNRYESRNLSRSRIRSMGKSCLQGCYRSI